MTITYRFTASSLSPAYQVALDAIGAGLSCVPIRADGSKQPGVPWKVYQERCPTQAELARWFRLPDAGLGLITGEVSGGLEALDFDDEQAFSAWRRRIESKRPLAALYEEIGTGYEEQTPAGGRHLLYRCQEIAGNQKLACRPLPDEQQKVKTLIETRGSGGLIIIDPSGGRVHKTGRPYRRLRGSVRSIVTITPAQRTLLLESARQFDEMPKVAQIERSPLVIPSPRAFSGSGAEMRPGDLFNAQARWDDLLASAGWTLVEVASDGEQYWRRPGKTDGISATANYQGNNRLRVFSTNAYPFEIDKTYSLFEAYTLLVHGGDFSAAARELAKRGYVERQVKR